MWLSLICSSHNDDSSIQQWDSSVSVDWSKWSNYHPMALREYSELLMPHLQSNCIHFLHSLLLSLSLSYFIQLLHQSLFFSSFCISLSLSLPAFPVDWRIFNHCQHTRVTHTLAQRSNCFFSLLLNWAAGIKCPVILFARYQLDTFLSPSHVNGEIIYFHRVRRTEEVLNSSRRDSIHTFREGLGSGVFFLFLFPSSMNG